MPGGRPSELTQEVLEEVKRLLPTVLYIETVADYLSLNRGTVGGWLRRGRIEHKRLAQKKKRRKREALYLEFFTTVRKALAEGEIGDNQTIKDASATQWTAAAWRLERRFPERYSRDRMIFQELARSDRENRDEIARLRSEIGATNAPRTEQTQGNTPPASEATGTPASD